MIVRETIEFSARCQRIGSRAEVSRREKEAGIVPDPDIDTYMKAISVEGQKKNLQTHCFEVNARCGTSQHQMRHVSTPDEPTEGI
ncbi:pleiotropic drug resistance protein 3-like isoform X2 [Rosa rugosa]|uniref:pleiotropic drug resistance protein 3-like isoform X2 n=1 Tax=Rosa rugosa TaxID=74645 RepID=UPI002B40B68A|nr:pleiotropic drug resistance protein 3-like isoform X2 [Rosa rugosa]XP_062001912.1 pleiotropic drug resistance protein 3-like isoform X2 [Rosa rugosa]